MTDRLPARPAIDRPLAATKGFPPDTVVALQAALLCENAAVWCYGLVAAYDASDAALIATIVAGHLARRDATAALLTAGGATPVGPAAVYGMPVAVKDVPTARSLSTVLETECARAWHAVIGTTDLADLRGIALAGLSDSSVWLTSLRIAAKTTVLTTAFPGQS